MRMTRSLFVTRNRAAHRGAARELVPRGLLLGGLLLLAGGLSACEDGAQNTGAGAGPEGAATEAAEAAPAAAGTPQPLTRDGVLTIETGAGATIELTVTLAATPGDRRRGLMFREDLPERHGMLFVYPRPRRLSFWMRNTPLPLDILFAAPDGRIVKIHENAKPYNETLIPSGNKVQYVLEIEAGQADALGLERGDRLRPALTPAAP